MDLTPFQRIKPCGYEGLETIDLASLIGADTARPETVKTELRARLVRNLGYNRGRQP
jgi:lipoate-protein ligase B